MSAHIEKTKTGRSKCKIGKEDIPKGDLKFSVSIWTGRYAVNESVCLKHLKEKIINAENVIETSESYKVW
jgi:hypothetical protein